MFHRTAERNREIFAAHRHGDTIEELSQRYALSPGTVREIIRIERHKAAVSIDSFYEEVRLKKA